MRFLLLIPFCLFGLIASCGWQLKGSLQPEADLESLYLDSQLATYQRGPDSIENSIEQRLDQIGVRITNSGSNAQLGLTILSEEVDETVLSLTSDLFEQQIRLDKTVSYQVWRGEELLVARNQVSTYRDISEDQGSAAAKNRERDLILDEINRDLTDQIIRRLQRFAAVSNADKVSAGEDTADNDNPDQGETH